MPKTKPAAEVDEEPKETETTEEATDTTSETTEETTESTEGTEEAPEAAQPSVEELQSQLQAKDKEIADLKSAAAPLAEKPVEVREGGAKYIATDAFLGTVLPEAKRIFLDEKATPEQKFHAVYDLSNKLVGAVLHDEVRPNVAAVAQAVIVTSNEVELLRLAKDSRLTLSVEKEVREELGRMKWEDRSDPQAVTKVFHRLIGAKSNGSLPAKPAAPRPSAVGKVLKDVAAGSGATTTRGTATGLTPDQQADLDEINAERPADEKMPTKLYLAKFKARQEKISSENKDKPADQHRRVPRYLREQV